MNAPRRQLDSREWTLAVIAAGLGGLFLLYWLLILPLVWQWREVRDQSRELASDFLRLRANLGVRDQVSQAFARLGGNVWQSASDEATVSAWLRELESLARHPGMMLVNMKPAPIKREKSHIEYRVRLLVSGRLSEILRFVTDATHGQNVVGIESFSLRGVSGGNMVECTLSLWMVKLPPEVRNTPSTSMATVQIGSVQ